MSHREFSKWKEFYCDSQKGAVWPNESLVRLFKGSYIPGFKDSYQGKKVLDIGFGSGNNLMFFGTLNMDLYGVEVHQDICLQAAEKLKAMGYNADLRAGDNRNIPFPDNFFDYIASWDVLHYEGQEDYIIEALAEYNRVLKPGGRLFLSTVAPDHTIFRNSKTLGNHRREISREDEFRKGQVFFCVDETGYLEPYFSKYFSNVLIGRAKFDYFTEVNDTYIVTGIKE